MGLNIRPGTSAEEIAARAMQEMGRSQAQPLPPVQGPANRPIQGPPMYTRDMLGDVPEAGVAPVSYIPGAAPATPAPQPQQGGFLGGLRNPDMQAKLMAFGQGMSQLAAGQAPNIAANPAYQAMMQRRSEADQRKQMEGLLEDLPPELRKVVATMPPGLGQKVIYEYMLEKMKPKVAPQLPNSIKEFQYALQNPEFAKFLETKRGGTTINMPGQIGSIPQGYRVVYDPETGAPTHMEAIPGGPADTSEKDAGREASRARAGDIVLEDIGRAKELVLGNPALTTGIMGGVLKEWSGSDAHDLNELTKTIRANIGFDRLQEMRDNSPTGGALGSIAIQELERLEAVLGSLAQSQSAEQFLRNLDRLDRVYNEIVHGAGERPAEPRKRVYDPSTGTFR